MSARILLLDQDDQFAAQMKAAAKKLGVDLASYTSVMNAGGVGSLGQYNLIISGPELENLSGQEVATYVDSFYKNIPVVLLDRDHPTPSPTLERPVASVKGRVAKSIDAESILRRALKFGGFEGKTLSS